MVWTPPKLFVEGEILTARDLNIYLRDNSMITEAAIATGFGQYLTTNADDELVERAVGYSEVIEEQVLRWGGTGKWIENSVVPEVTLETGSIALVCLSANLSIAQYQVPDGAGGFYDPTDYVAVAVDIPGSTNIQGTGFFNTPMIEGFIQGGANGNPIQAGVISLITNLPPGINTFKCKYRCSTGGLDLVSNQKLFVMPF